MQVNGKVPIRIKSMFGLGQAAESIKNFGFGTLLLLYYNQVLGLSGTYSGMAVFIAIVVDALCDPTVGSWSDGFKSRWGRRHPFMLASIIPMGITYYLLFMPPEGLSEFQLFLWLTVFSVLVRASLTFFHVPYLSLGAEMTQDYHERTTIVVFRTAFGLIASLAVIAITWNFFFLRTPENPTPQLTRDPYFSYSLLCSAVMVVMMLLCVWGTAPAIPHLAGSRQKARAFGLRQVYSDIFQAMQNRTFNVLFFSTLLFFIYAGTHGALAMHLKTFFWQLDTRAIAWWQYGAVAGGVIGLPLVPNLNRWVDKKWTVIIGCLGSATVNTVPVGLQLLGLMPADPEVLVPILIACSVLSAIFGVQAAVTVASMMGDIADAHELEHGTRQEGIYFGSYSFSTKCTTALGNLVAGFALDLIAFPVNSKPGMLSTATLEHFGIMYCAVTLILIVSTYIFWGYDLDKQKHDEIVAKLRARPAPPQEASEPGLEGEPAIA